MSLRQPSPGAQRMIYKLVVNLIDWQEVQVQRADGGESLATSGGPLGVVRSDGSMEFDESVVGALERAAEPGRLSDQEVADFRQAVRVVTFTTLNKRSEGFEIVLDAENEADQFVNVGMREAYWTVHGQRICYNLSPEHGSRLLDAADSVDNPVAREAALALAHQYATSHHEPPDRAVRALLRVPRDQVFERVVDGTLADHLRDEYKSSREGLSDLRGRLAFDLREGVAEVARASADGSIGVPEAHERVANLCARVNEYARTVQTLTASLRPQAGRSPAAKDHGAVAGPAQRRTTGFEPLAR